MHTAIVAALVCATVILAVVVLLLYLGLRLAMSQLDDVVQTLSSLQPLPTNRRVCLSQEDWGRVVCLLNNIREYLQVPR